MIYCYCLKKSKRNDLLLYFKLYVVYFVLQILISIKRIQLKENFLFQTKFKIYKIVLTNLYF